MTATLSRVLDLSSTDRARLREALAKARATALRHAKISAEQGRPDICREYREEGDALDRLALKLGLGLLL